MKLALFVPLVVLALSACSPSPTTAAVVGDTTIAQQRVDALLEKCPTFIENIITEDVALTLLVRTELFRTVGEASGIDMSDERLDTFLRENDEALEIIRQAPDCVDVLKPQAAQILIEGEADPDDVQAVLASTEVTVNPRRFQWDDQQGAVVPGSGSVSVPGGQG